jgi:23S rRNA pseudouridine1911/1915/1917 synthase
LKENKPASSYIVVVPSEEMLGLRLDKALSLLSEIVTRSRAENLIERGLVFVDQKPGKSSQKISGKENIVIHFPEATPSKLQPLERALDIVFEDSDLLVINKPAGLVVHPAAGHAQDTLVNMLLHHTKDLSMKFGENRPGIVHRLDRDTSGLLVVAKNDFAHENLALQFKNKTSHRIYNAVCFGIPPVKSGVIQSFLARSPMDRKKYASVMDRHRKIIRTLAISHLLEKPEGKWAVTHYQVLRSSYDFSYLQLKLETGRTHQIRVHLSELGYPLVADPIYCSAERRIKQMKNAEIRGKAQAISRLALHASELGFSHPRSGKPLLFKQDWPQEMRAAIRTLGLL